MKDSILHGRGGFAGQALSYYALYLRPFDCNNKRYINKYYIINNSCFFNELRSIVSHILVNLITQKNINKKSINSDF